jgi:hypothetical protein
VATGINDWKVDVLWDTSSFDKAAQRVEKTLGRIAGIKSKVAASTSADRVSSKVGTAKSKALSKENSLLAQQNILRKRISKAEELGLGKTRMSSSQNPVFLRRKILELDKQIFAQQQKMKKEAAKLAKEEAKSAKEVVSKAPIRAGPFVGPIGPRTLGGEKLLEKRAAILAKIEKQERRINSSIKVGTKAYNQQIANVRRLKTQLQGITEVRAFSKLSRDVQRLGENVSNTTGKIKQQKFAVKSLDSSVRNLARSYVSVFAVLEGGKGLIGTATRFDSLDASMLAASGSAEQAIVDFGFIKNLSFELGIGLETVTDGYYIAA